MTDLVDSSRHSSTAQPAVVESLYFSYGKRRSNLGTAFHEHLIYISQRLWLTRNEPSPPRKPSEAGGGK